MKATVIYQLKQKYLIQKILSFLGICILMAGGAVAFPNSHNRTTSYYDSLERLYGMMCIAGLYTFIYIFSRRILLKVVLHESNDGNAVAFYFRNYLFFKKTVGCNTSDLRFYYEEEYAGRAYKVETRLYKRQKLFFKTHTYDSISEEDIVDLINLLIDNGAKPYSVS